jgi:hypothetical protein
VGWRSASDAMSEPGPIAGDRSVVDAWMQHPTPRFLAHPMFASLRRWAHGALGSDFLHGNAERVFALTP